LFKIFSGLHGFVPQSLFNNPCWLFNWLDNIAQKHQSCPFNEVKAYMEKQQSVIDRLTEMMATMKKETSDPQVFVTSENSAKVTYNSAKEICKYPSFSKVGGNYPLDLEIIWSSEGMTVIPYMIAVSLVCWFVVNCRREEHKLS
jgi:hypothetical protein